MGVWRPHGENQRWRDAKDRASNEKTAAAKATAVFQIIEEEIVKRYPSLAGLAATYSSKP
jgi:hypothetical protein